MLNVFVECIICLLGFDVGSRVSGYQRCGSSPDIYSYSDVSASCIRSSNAYISRDSKTDDIMKKIFESQMQFSKWTTILGILCLMQIDWLFSASPNLPISFSRSSLRALDYNLQFCLKLRLTFYYNSLKLKFSYSLKTLQFPCFNTHVFSQKSP